MEQNINLLEGKISRTLFKLAMPIMGTSFIQMAYNLTDMFWLGKAGSDAVAAVGTAGYFIWFGQAFIFLSKSGTEIRVAHYIGKRDFDKTTSIIENGIKLNIILAIIYGLFLIIFKNPLIGFFNLGAEHIIKMAKDYLVVVSLGMAFNFINPLFTGILNGSGNSKTPFIINTIGLIANIVLDPLFIFGFGFIPEMGAFGAALATVLAQVIVSLYFIFIILKSKEEYLKIKLFSKLNLRIIRDILNLGFPIAIQNGLFCMFSMVLGRIVAVYGPVAIAVQKVGSQIESISWMTAGGFATALGAFAAQNYGGKKYDRITKGYFTTLKMALVVGVFATILLVFFGDIVFESFIDEDEAIKLGIDYLKILGYSQLFMCIEITTSGFFNGIGRTKIPSIISIIFTGSRIPLAILLSRKDILGLNGIWWSISLTSVIKGVLIVIILAIFLKKSKIFKNKGEII